jgi:radical SAM protein with 4Fe4S-binding SPASM domain
VTDTPRLLHRFHRLAAERCIPLSVSFELTHYCNLDCAHCYVVRHGRPSPDELTTDEVREVLDHLAEAGTLKVSFTGGEVFTRSDWPEILAHAREKDFAIQIITNGTLLGRDEVARLADLAPWEVAVSLYADSAEIHDGVVGVEGAFAKTTKAIELLRKLGLRTAINMLLMDCNFSRYPAVLALAKNLGTSLVLDPVVSPRNDGNLDNRSLAISLEQFRQILTDPEVPASALKLEGTQLEATREQRLSHPVCGAGITTCTVDPTGRVLPCLQWLKPAGNLRGGPFVGIWKDSPVFAEIRGATVSNTPECRDCEYVALCNRCPANALLETGDPRRPYPVACSMAKVIHEVRAASNQT